MTHTLNSSAGEVFDLLKKEQLFKDTKEND